MLISVVAVALPIYISASQIKCPLISVTSEVYHLLEADTNLGCYVSFQALVSPYKQTYMVEEFMLLSIRIIVLQNGSVLEFYIFDFFGVFRLRNIFKRVRRGRDDIAFHFIMKI